MTRPETDRFVLEHMPAPELQPEFLFELPELHYPDRLNVAAELLASAPQDDPAIVNDLGSWTYGELDDFSGRIAHMLRDRFELVPGNRVLLTGMNGMKLIAAWLGIIKAGGVVVAIVPILRPVEIAKVLRKARVSHAIVHDDCREAVELAAQASEIELKTITFGDDVTDCDLQNFAASAEPVPAFDTASDDPALIAFTSGTTGVPKGCIQFHRDVLASADSFARHILKPRAGMRWTCTAPLAFTFGLGMQYIFPLRFGGTAVTPLEPGAKGLMRTIEAHRVQICATAPTAYRGALELLDDHDIGSLETCVSAGEHLPAAIWQSWKEQTGHAIVDGIGATEMMHIFISASGEDIRQGATGKAVPGYTATVLDEEDQPLPYGTGRLAVKGPTGCRYLDDERQTDYVVNGWNVTGDTFRLDEDGYFWYVARSDDMIISSGYNIAGPEVEEALYAHTAVAECAVIGVPCDRRGSKVKAFVVLSGRSPDDAIRQELQEHVKRTIAPYKYPREIDFVDELPKTVTGKLKRFALREGPKAR